jgi:hypothetical protein
MYICKIDAIGWNCYTGLVGTVPFKDGISERPLTDQEIARLGAVIRLVRVDSDEQVGAAVTMAGIGHVSAEVVAPSPTLEDEQTEQKVELKYDREKLLEVASEGGIKAIREIAKEFDVKGVEINRMIDDIVKAQQGTE